MEFWFGDWMTTAEGVCIAIAALVAGSAWLVLCLIIRSAIPEED